MSEGAGLDSLIECLTMYIEPHFAIRLSSLQTRDQLLRELKAICPDQLPLVIMIFDQKHYDSTIGVETVSLTLALVDQFKADSSERALSLFHRAEELAALFPASGVQLGEFHVHPEDCQAASPDGDYAVFAFGISCKTGY